MDYSKLKASYFDKSTQFVLFDTDGEVVNTCSTLFKIPLIYNVYDEIPFLQSLSDILNNTPNNETLKYPCIRMNILGYEGYFDLVFHRKDNMIHWFINDLSDLYEDLIHIQQERNVAAIGEELLQAQQSVSKLEKELLTFQNEELKRIQNFKTEFFAKVSHEIRTPVSGIIGLSKLITLEDNTENEKYLDTIKATSNHLLSIVNDVLDLSKIEAGKLELSNQDFNLRKLVHQVLCSFEPAIKEKLIYLNVEIDDDIPALVFGDPVRLSQILFNIVGNSVRFTDKGGVAIGVRLISQAGDSFKIQFQISDTGIGIEANKIENILNPYSQENSQESIKYGGTGLGLSVVKQLVDLHSGELLIESEKGLGTTITIDLEYKESAKSEQLVETVELESNLPENKKALLVDDDDLNLKIAEQLLIKNGFEVTVAKDGKSVITLLEKQQYGFVLLDYNMDDFNGEDILFYIRNHENEEIRQLAVYILTAGLSSEKIDKLKDIGVSDVFLKPLSEKQLVTVLKKDNVETYEGTFFKEVNLDFVKSISDGDNKKLVEIVNTFQSKIPEVLKIIQETLDNRDWYAMGRAIHKIKPNFSYLGVNKVVDLLEKLENEIEGDPNVEVCEKIVALTGNYFSKVNEQINKELFQLKLD